VELLQDIVVGLVALGAVAIVARRVVGEFRDEVTDPTCDHCAVHQPDAITPPPPQPTPPEA
jgi:hypothetical protein